MGREPAAQLAHSRGTALGLGEDEAPANLLALFL
jgi:hypothetical protein